MAEAPKCANFPSCGKRHFGACESAYIRSLESGSREKVRGAAGLIPAETPETIRLREDFYSNPPMKIDPLEQRVATLEKLVHELCETKRKRSKYMKFYMRRKRKEQASE